MRTWLVRSNQSPKECWSSRCEGLENVPKKSPFLCPLTLLEDKFVAPWIMDKLAEVLCQWNSLET
jgi:hypothetical protein